MAGRQPKRDDEARQGVFLVFLLGIGALVLGLGMHWLWKNYSTDAKAEDAQVRYLSLGEHTMATGNRSLLMQVSIEYVGRETEQTLARSLPLIKGQVTRRLSQMQEKDLRKLQTPKGKQQLASDILAMIQDSLPDEASRNVKEVLYEKFLMGE